jgi:hypothetical protein
VQIKSLQQQSLLNIILFKDVTFLNNKKMIRTLIARNRNYLFKRNQVGIRFINVDTEKEDKKKIKRIMDKSVNEYISESLIEGTKLSAISFGTGLGYYGSTVALAKLGVSASILGIAVPCVSMISVAAVLVLLNDNEVENDAKNGAVAMVSGLAISPLLFTSPILYPSLVCSNVGLIGGALVSSYSIKNNKTSISRWTYPVRVSSLSALTYIGGAQMDLWHLPTPSHFISIGIFMYFYNREIIKKFYAKNEVSPLTHLSYYLTTMGLIYSDTVETSIFNYFENFYSSI